MILDKTNRNKQLIKGQRVLSIVFGVISVVELTGRVVLLLGVSA